MHTDKTSFIIY